MTFLPALAEGAAELFGGAEAATAGTEAATAGETAGAGAVAKDFNDAPVAKTVGSSFGRKVVDSLAAGEVAHGIEGAFGRGGGGGGQGAGGPPSGGVDLGSMGNI
jgi:hypothetical protein